MLGRVNPKSSPDFSDGTHYYFFPNGDIKKQITYKNGKPDGIEINTHENGNLQYIYRWKNGVKKGLQQDFHENGRLYQEADHKNDDDVNFMRIYREDGTLDEETIYRKNFRETKSYYENGQLGYQLIVKGNQSVERGYHPNGKLESETIFDKNNQTKGTKFYDEQGTLMPEGDQNCCLSRDDPLGEDNESDVASSTVSHYEGGQLHGLQQTFYKKSGKLKKEVTYEKGRIVGTMKEYYQSGVIAKTTEILDGNFETRIEKEFDEQGALKQEAVYRGDMLLLDPGWCGSPPRPTQPLYRELKTYYPDGKLKRVEILLVPDTHKTRAIQYHEGQMRSFYDVKAYHENGQLLLERQAGNDVTDKEYDESGRLKKETVFKNGIPVETREFKDK